MRLKRGAGGVTKDLAPLRARLLAKRLGEQALHRRPLTHIELIGQRLRVERKALQQRGIKLRLDGAHGHVLGVRRFIGLVEVRAGIQQVHATLVTMQSRRLHGERHRHQ